MAKRPRIRWSLPAALLCISTVIVAVISTPSASASAPRATSVPGPPTGVTASPGYGSAGVSWRAPVSDGGSAITNYRVTSSPGSKFCTTRGATSCTVPGLKNGATFSISVQARNKTGLGAPSAPVKVTPGVPQAPADVQAMAGNAEATITWAAAVDNRSPITHYTLTSSPASKICTTAATSCMLTGLKNDTAYKFRLTATNARGTGPESAFSPSVLPPIVRTIPLDEMSGIASDGTHVWVGNSIANTVTELNASNGSVVRTIAVGDGPSGSVCGRHSRLGDQRGLQHGDRDRRLRRFGGPDYSRGH